MQPQKLTSFDQLKKLTGNLGAKRWTRSEDDELKKLWALGEDDETIARKINRSKHGVQMRRSKLKIVGKRKGGKTLATRRPAKPTPDIINDVEGLRTTQAVLKSLGYKLAIVKLTD